MTDDTDRLSCVVAEMRAAELVRALRAAVNGSAHWRTGAQQLLRLIDTGVPPDHVAPCREAAEDRSLRIELLSEVEPDD